MTAFEQYAPWYDLLYQDKDYASETSFVDEQLRRHGAGTGTLLDLGCGTGVHAVEFARKGWTVTGIDLSPDMIRRADARRAEAPRDACGSGRAMSARSVRSGISTRPSRCSMLRATRPARPN